MVTGIALLGGVYLGVRKIQRSFNTFSTTVQDLATKAVKKTEKKIQNPLEAKIVSEDAKLEERKKEMEKLMKEYAGGFESKMSRKEAARILNIKISATPKEVKLAHRRLMSLNHPDTGGSAFVATKINEAKENLLKTN